MNKLHEACLSSHRTFTGLKQDLERLFGHPTPMSDEYGNRANEVAQLVLPAEMEIEVEEVRERLAYVQLGIMHPKRLDK